VEAGDGWLSFRQVAARASQALNMVIHRMQRSRWLAKRAQDADSRVSDQAEE